MTTTHSKAGPSSAPFRISGSIPGILDPTQPHRLLRWPNSRLSFAFFDPLVAVSQADTRYLKQSHPPKRVVIEHTPDGQQYWRFVPRARLDNGVLDEGEWPRIINICGHTVECSQDQWDIYKLDPLYECRVCAPPALTVIILNPQQPPEFPYLPGGKRVGPDSSVDANEFHPPPRKKVNILSTQTSINDTDAEEVERMVIDDSTPGPSRSKKFREEIDKRRSERREKVSRRAKKLSNPGDESIFSFPPNDRQSKSVPPEPSKRKVSTLFGSLSPHEELFEDEGAYDRCKRTRTVSPTSAKRELQAKRLERERQKRERREHELKARRQSRENSFLRHVYEEVPSAAAAAEQYVDSDVQMQSASQQSVDMSSSDTQSIDSEDELPDDDEREDSEDIEEAARQAAIAESRRKLAELEADRPLWEQQARLRQQREREEAEALRRRAEDRRRAELKRQQQAEAERLAKAERQAQARDEAYRREREAAARREREKCQRQARWSLGPWTAQRALERYKSLCEYFDTAKFNQDNPLSFDVIPWPILNPPATMSVQDVNWVAVERFFKLVMPHMVAQDYIPFVEQSHRRFHPDRWRSRNLLKSVADESERNCLEVASNTVAQALTPIWRELKGR